MWNAFRTANSSLLVKQKIQGLNKYHFPPPASVGMMLKNNIALNVICDINPAFPPLDADIAANGAAIAAFHDQCDDVMDQFSPEDIFMLGGHDADPERFFATMRAGGSEFAEGASDLVTKMVKMWYEAADQYAEKRKQSATKQLTNMDVPADQIQAIISDPMKLRQFISAMRKDLTKKLELIWNKMRAKDIMNLPTQKEIVLFDTHREWFLDGAGDDTEYYPNDSAVHYPMLIHEICSMIRSQANLNPTELHEVFVAVMSVAHKTLTSQSSREGWLQLAALPDTTIHGVNIATVLRSYTTDENRCIKEGAKQSSPLGRGPLRLLRIACCIMGKPGPFSILNAADSEFIAVAVKLLRDEDEIKELSKSAKFVKAHAEDFFVSLSMTWLKVLERDNLFNILTGRNDLAVPKLVGAAVGIQSDAFEDLNARDWSLDHDIIGESEDVDSLEVRWFADDRDVVYTQPPSIGGEGESKTSEFASLVAGRGADEAKEGSLAEVSEDTTFMADTINQLSTQPNLANQVQTVMTGDEELFGGNTAAGTTNMGTPPVQPAFGSPSVYQMMGGMHASPMNLGSTPMPQAAQPGTPQSGRGGRGNPRNSPGRGGRGSNNKPRSQRGASKTKK